MSDTTCRIEHNPLSTLYLAFELGNEKWTLGFTIGLGQSPRERTIVAGDLTTLHEEVRLAKKRFKLPQTARVMSCYEAGRDSFWCTAICAPKTLRTWWWIQPALRSTPSTSSGQALGEAGQDR